MTQVIVVKAALLAFVGHHHEAYAWAEKRRIEPHPRTGVAQIVEVRERVEEGPPSEVRDVDGRVEDRRGTISVFDGPPPVVDLAVNEASEIDRVAAFIRECLADGVAPVEIGVFVRSRAELPRARASVAAAGLSEVELSERLVETKGRVAIATMHLAKGLEFKAVAVMACDEDVLPLAERIDSVVEESDLEEVFDTERHLLYVACTRARDRLLVTGVKPGSEFLMDLARGAA